LKFEFLIDIGILLLFNSLLFVLTQKVTKKSRLNIKKRLFYVVMLVRNPSR